jgi:primosomal protein N' (replication factor Y)
VPALPPLSLRFAEWVARYTLAPLGMVVRMMMGSSAVFEPVKPRFGVKRNGDAPVPPRMTPARKRALEIAADGLIRAKGALAAETGCSTGVIDGLIAAGTLVEVAIPERRLPVPNPAHARTDLSDAQARAAHAMRAAADARAFSVTLLDGVTGSGKTEVYFEAVARSLEKGRQALIMLPEIALTSQFMDRFTRRFGCPPVEWHSALSSAERGRAWRAAATGEARVVVGARSALFLPFKDLGLIVVDEEHDTGFKQEDRVHYQARDMGVVRGSLGKFAVVLSSATPSIESHVNARSGRYAQVDLPGRYLGAEMPEVRGHRPAAAPARARQVALAGAGRGRHPDAAPTAAGAALPQPPRLRAAHAVPHLRPPHRLPAVHGLAGRAPLSPPARVPPLAASRCRSRRNAPSAASPMRSWPAARASSASPRRWRSDFRTPAWPCSPPTSCPR